MRKIAFMFPGQGAQYTGMGKDFYEQIPSAREMIDLAGQVCGLDLPGLCFQENPQLHITEYTQIAMLAVSIAMWKTLKERGVHSQVNGGLSLGEYGALVASGALDAADAFALVRKRGIFMQNAVPKGGAMRAVLGMDGAVIEEICRKTEGMVSIANYNCPGQIVITGEEQAVEAASQALKEAGARRVLPLKVSGPFHSPMLRTAGEQLEQALEKIEIHPLQVPYLSNVTGEAVKDSRQVKELLIQQVCAPVRWQQCVESMLWMGVDTFVEIGPGHTLTGFLKKINRGATALNVEKVEDLDTVVKECVK